MPFMMQDFYTGAQGAMDLQMNSMKMQQFKQMQSALQQFYSSPQPVSDAGTDTPGGAYLKQAQEFSQLAQVYSRYDPKQSKEYMDSARESMTMYQKYQTDTSEDMSRTLNSVQDQASLNTAWDTLYQNHPEEAKRLASQYPELKQWSPATRSRLGVLVQSLDKTGKISSLNEKRAEFQQREQDRLQFHQDSMENQAANRQARLESHRDAQATKEQATIDRKESQLQSSYQREQDRLDAAEDRIDTNILLDPKKKEEQKRTIANRRRALDLRYKQMGFDPKTMTYSPPSAQREATPKAKDISSDTKAQNIKSQFQAGKITKEEAVRKLKELGYE